ncbi:uncharacterized protein N7477_008161 [Penicillium maclennaniae]|uniref:uncharacterized protein n=1 Tax=Penicillium maclennaniae TaxID=1343394 RepID=UPI0025417139|nr:uncharacterized protein N7477_008161 [Penicillium maclennaniae]KAJ5665713.1 hypothetical protein N7477_008161 [Penicillium maclennaniae]
MARRLSEFAGTLIHGLNCCCCLSGPDSERSSIELNPMMVPLPSEDNSIVADETPATETIERISFEGSSSTKERALIEDITPNALPTTVQLSEFQERGAQIRRWIDDPQEHNCHISKSTLTWPQLAEMGYSLRESDTTTLGDLDPHRVDVPIPGNVSRFYACSNGNSTCVWDGFAGEGAIALNTIKRQKGSPAPQISQITQAIYTRHHAIDRLRYVFVRNVVNEETLDFVQHQLYTEAHGPKWPHWVPRAWKVGTPRYDALLGTRIGKVVGYLVLGAFDRGTRRIKQIYTWPSMSGSSVNFRFDIEVIA